MQLDLSFLSAPLAAAPVAAAPVNVYDILRDAWRETRVDMTLLFFLDPNERHGLGPLVMDALLTALDGSPTIGPEGKGDNTFDAQRFLGSDAWTIGTQVEYIDVYAFNEDLGIAVVLENKIGHMLHNPLESYAKRALRGENVQTLLVAVLAPERRMPTSEQEPWLSRSVTYEELSGQIKQSPALVEHLLCPADQDQRRSLDLLQQFIEVRTGGTTMTDIAAEAARVDMWRGIEAEHGEAIRAFLDARRGVARVLRDRNTRLEPLISAELERCELETGWEAHGGSGLEMWNAYHFPVADRSIELKLSAKPPTPDIFVYDYPGRSYKDPRIEALGLPWTAPDEELATAFVERAQRILEQVVSASRKGLGTLSPPSA